MNKERLKYFTRAIYHLGKAEGWQRIEKDNYTIVDEIAEAILEDFSIVKKIKKHE